jgi:hypothetical protein
LRFIFWGFLKLRSGSGFRSRFWVEEMRCAVLEEQHVKALVYGNVAGYAEVEVAVARHVDAVASDPPPRKSVQSLQFNVFRLGLLYGEGACVGAT